MNVLSVLNKSRYYSRTERRTKKKGFLSFYLQASLVIKQSPVLKNHIIRPRRSRNEQLSENTVIVSNSILAIEIEFFPERPQLSAGRTGPDGRGPPTVSTVGLIVGPPPLKKPWTVCSSRWTSASPSNTSRQSRGSQFRRYLASNYSPHIDSLRTVLTIIAGALGRLPPFSPPIKIMDGLESLTQLDFGFSVEHVKEETQVTFRREATPVCPTPEKVEGRLVRGPA